MVRRLSLIEPMFIEGVGEILTFGAQKYAPNNWKELPYNEIWRYKDALLRHLMAYLDGEYIDRDSGKEHLKHIGCNLMFLTWMEDNKIQEDLYA